MSIAIPVLAATIVTIRARRARRPPPQRTVASHPGSGTRRRGVGNRHPVTPELGIIPLYLIIATLGSIPH